MECERTVKTVPLDDQQMPVVADHYAVDRSSVPLDHSNDMAPVTTAASDGQDNEPFGEQRTMRPSKSDSALTVKDSSEQGCGLPKVTSKSSLELSQAADKPAARNIPTHLQVEPLHPQIGYSVSPTHNGNVVPFTSYSSSEDEDDMEFFDADEYHDLDSNMSRLAI